MADQDTLSFDWAFYVEVNLADQYPLSFDWTFYRIILEDEEYSNIDWVWLIGL